MSGPPVDKPIRYTGARVKRLEDPRLLRGRGRYVGDLTLAGLASVAFVRSPHAHALVRKIDVAAALELPGVIAVLTARDLDGQARPLVPRLGGGGFVPTEWPPLASDRVRFSGEAVAAVVAESAYIAADARERVGVEYEPLAALATIE